jgi:uncharacterized protein YukE
LATPRQFVIVFNTNHLDSAVKATSFGRKQHMPAWQPNWADVKFNFAEAEEAIGACRTALAVLHERHMVLAGPRQHATETWDGNARKTFDVQWAQLEGLAEHASNELLATMNRIKAEADAARREQAFRESERARWYREKAAEDAALQQQQPPSGKPTSSGSPTPTPDTSLLEAKLNAVLNKK